MMNADFTKPRISDSEVNEVSHESSNLASEFFYRIIEMIYQFEATLDPNEEVGARLVSFGQSIQFHIEKVGYYNPSLITFTGKIGNGSRVVLVQHVNQISFLLMSLPKIHEDKPARRIGFQVNEEDE